MQKQSCPISCARPAARSAAKSGHARTIVHILVVCSLCSWWKLATRSSFWKSGVLLLRSSTRRWVSAPSVLATASQSTRATTTVFNLQLKKQQVSTRFTASHNRAVVLPAYKQTGSVSTLCSSACRHMYDVAWIYTMLFTPAWVDGLVLTKRLTPSCYVHATSAAAAACSPRCHHPHMSCCCCCYCYCHAAVDELSLDASAGALEASIQLGELDEAASQV